MSSDLEEQRDELLALFSIFGPDEFVQTEPSSGELKVSVELPRDFIVALKEGDTLTQYEVSSLPSLVLTFALPEDYPSCSAPSFSLSCSWLTPTQLSSLAAQLNDLYQSTGGAVVLFSWAQFLKDETLSFMGLHNVLEIPFNGLTTSEKSETPESTNHIRTSSNELTSQNKNDPSVEQNYANGDSQIDEGAARLAPQTPLCLSPGQALMSQLLIYDAAQKEKAFSSTQFECGVCFMNWLGSECIQFIECCHVFCRICLAEFCKLQITNGNVRDLTCPQTGCESAPTPAQVRTLVGEELFCRYDRLLLQSTLDRMPDVMFCPRPSCASAVLTDNSSSAAQCSVCGFAFCVLCKKTYHGAEDCQTRVKKRSVETTGQQTYADIPETREGRMALRDDYCSGSRDRQRLLESRYGRSNMIYFMEDSLSWDWIKDNSKTCPHCFSHIEKNGGCNYMYCSRCQRTFCWACLAKNPAGDHFVQCPTYW